MLIYSPQIAVHELQASRLAQRVEELENENNTQRQRIDQVHLMRQREQDALQIYAQQGRDMSDYVSKAQLAEHLNQMRSAREEETKELWRELEATSDIFMPKTKLEAILNAHESQLDEIRRLLSARPQESVSARRVWNENLQTFQEVDRQLPTPATPISLSTKPKSGLELEMDLMKARKDYDKLEMDISQLQTIRNSLTAVEEENLRRVDAITPTIPYVGFPDRSDAKIIDAASPYGSTKVGKVGSENGLLFSGQSGNRGESRHLLETNSLRRLMADAEVSTDDFHPFSPSYATPKRQSTRGTGFQTPVFTHTDLPTQAVPSPIHGADSDYILTGEDWMLNSRILDMLHVREDSRQRIARLREEAQSKVLELREKARSNPTRMSFSDKMAYFTTAGANIHQDIQNRQGNTE